MRVGGGGKISVVVMIGVFSDKCSYLYITIG